MCKNRRDNIIAALREHFPYKFVANNIFVGEDGKSKEGYTTEFKRKVGELLNMTTPPFTPGEIASAIGVDARCIMLWKAKYLRGHFNKANPRDKVYASGGKLTVVSQEDYHKIQLQELRNFSKENNLTDEQFKHLSSSMEQHLEKNYLVFRENDGDWDNLTDYLELVFMEYVTDPDSSYQDIKTVEEVVKEQPIETMIDTAQQRVDRVRMHWDEFKKIACPPITMVHVRCYMLSHKPKAPEDILLSMSTLPDWRTKQDRNRAYARLMDYSDTYVGPHVDKKVIPLTIRNKLSKQVICLPNNKWMVIPVKIMKYIEKCRIEGSWDWDALMLPDCPIPRMSVPMRTVSGILYQQDTNDDDKMLFGRPIQDINTWQYYVDMVRTIAPETAIPLTDTVTEKVVTLMSEETSAPVVADTTDLESLSSSVLDALCDDDHDTANIIDDEADTTLDNAHQDTSLPDVTNMETRENVAYHVTAYHDESYDGMKYFTPLDLSGMQSVGEIEAYIHNAIISTLRAVDPLKQVSHHDIVLLSIQNRENIHITGHSPYRVYAPVQQVWSGTSLVTQPCNCVMGCGQNRVSVLNDGKHILLPKSVCFTADELSGIILTVINGEPLHMEFVKR